MLSGQPQGIAPTEHGYRYIKTNVFENPGQFFALVPKLQPVGLLFPKLQFGKQPIAMDKVFSARCAPYLTC